ncbi:MAG: SDR family NAD(P)-dependent oxidoreductase [Burkholderiales bacterium]|jgi:NAD(P)-dependent dehydrogenase (short-subunit alcohol dehydrogenase family)|nr:SDR family NAD(P)-dependent oxidoreductase [Burkholderiales bacterium]
MQKIAIITGGSSGIGKETVQLFLSNNWNVISLSRSACNIANVLDIQVDFSDENFLDKLKVLLSDQLNNASLITIIHNSCAYYSGTIDNVNIQELNKAWLVNIIAPIKINQLVIPHMQPGSSIIYIGSTLSEMAVKNSAPYVISKHAVVGLMRSTCQDISTIGIHTCCICPGFTDTKMLKEHLTKTGRSLNEIADYITMNRLIKPQEIADFIWHCSNNPILNGSVLHANLGFINR